MNGVTPSYIRCALCVFSKKAQQNKNLDSLLFACFRKQHKLKRSHFFPLFLCFCIFSFPFLLSFFGAPFLSLFFFSPFPCFFLFCPSFLAPLLDPRGASARYAPPRIRHWARLNLTKCKVTAIGLKPASLQPDTLGKFLERMSHSDDEMEGLVKYFLQEYKMF